MTSSKGKPGIRNVPPPTGGSKPSSIYGRFIPREELGGFAAWNPDAISGAPNAAPAKPAEPAAPSAEDIAQMTRAARQAGYQDGYRDGLAALENFKQTFVQQCGAQVGQVALAYDAQLDALQQRMARTLAVSAAQLARQVVRSELAARPELIGEVAEEALDAMLLSARHIVVRLHPEDVALVADSSSEAIEARGARLVADASVSRGGCLVEADIGVVDATIEARWRRAVAAIGCDDDWATGESAAEEAR